MTNPQYILSVALGVGAEGLKRRELYEKAADGKPLSQWVREAIDKAAWQVLRTRNIDDVGGLMAMITQADVEALRHTEYNSDPVVMEMLATIEELWKQLPMFRRFDTPNHL